MSTRVSKQKRSRNGQEKIKKKGNKCLIALNVFDRVTPQLEGSMILEPFQRVMEHLFLLVTQFQFIGFGNFRTRPGICAVLPCGTCVATLIFLKTSSHAHRGTH